MKVFGLISCTALMAALSGCGPMTQEDIASISGALNSFQAQNERINARTTEMVQEGQRNMSQVVQSQPTIQDSWKTWRYDGVAIYCIKLSTQVVTCKPI